jgi:hypothetical protein
MNSDDLPGGSESQLTAAQRPVRCSVLRPRQRVFDSGGNTSVSEDANLFGFGPTQGSLFGAGEGRLQAPTQRYVPDPEKVRQRLKLLLDKARSADRMPWSERDARMWCSRTWRTGCRRKRQSSRGSSSPANWSAYGALPNRVVSGP